MAIVGENKAYPLEKLKFDPQNARRHDERNIKTVMNSLELFGQHAPLVVREMDNVVVVGNGRLEAMRRLGWETAWVVFVDDDEMESVKRSLLDNRSAELASWDWGVLEDLLNNMDVGRDFLGFDMLGDVDIDDLLDTKESKLTTGKGSKKITCPYCGKEFEV